MPEINNSNVTQQPVQTSQTGESLSAGQESVGSLETDRGLLSTAVQRAVANPSKQTLTPQVLMAIQRTHGNRFAQGLIARSRQATPPRPYSLNRPDSNRRLNGFQLHRCCLR